MRDVCHAVVNNDDRTMDNKQQQTRTHEWLLGTTAALHNTTCSVGVRHPGALAEVMLLSECVAGHSPAWHTGCRGSFAPLYCGRSVASLIGDGLFVLYRSVGVLCEKRRPLVDR